MSEELKLFNGFRVKFTAYPAIGALVAHKIPSLLQQGPKTAEELASLVSLSPSKLFRFLRLASHFKVFSLNEATKKWENTPKSLLLASPVSQALWDCATDPLILEYYIHTKKILESDETPEIILNKPNFFCKYPKILNFSVNFRIQ